MSNSLQHPLPSRGAETRAQPVVGEHRCSARSARPDRRAATSSTSSRPRPAPGCPRRRWRRRTARGPSPPAPPSAGPRRARAARGRPPRQQFGHLGGAEPARAPPPNPPSPSSATTRPARSTSPSPASVSRVPDGTAPPTMHLGPRLEQDERALRVADFAEEHDVHGPPGRGRVAAATRDGVGHGHHPCGRGAIARQPPRPPLAQRDHHGGPLRVARDHRPQRPRNRSWNRWNSPPCTCTTTGARPPTPSRSAWPCARSCRTTRCAGARPSGRRSQRGGNASTPRANAPTLRRPARHVGGDVPDVPATAQRGLEQDADVTGDTAAGVQARRAQTARRSRRVTRAPPAVPAGRAGPISPRRVRDPDHRADEHHHQEFGKSNKRRSTVNPLTTHVPNAVRRNTTCGRTDLRPASADHTRLPSSASTASHSTRPTSPSSAAMPSSLKCETMRVAAPRSRFRPQLVVVGVDRGEPPDAPAEPRLLLDRPEDVAMMLSRSSTSLEEPTPPAARSQLMNSVQLIATKTTAEPNAGEGQQNPRAHGETGHSTTAEASHTRGCGSGTCPPPRPPRRGAATRAPPGDRARGGDRSRRGSRRS